MGLQDKYDELDNIINTLDVLIDEIEDKDYKEQLQMIMYEANKEKEIVEEKLQKYYDEEEKEMEKQYWNSQF